MTAESPQTPSDQAPANRPPGTAGEQQSLEPASRETVSLLGLARDSSVGGLHFVPPSLDELGAALPQFSFEELLGAGGMGAVYRVRQKELDRAAALKVLPRELAERPEFQERFMREAKALASLNHPHLVTVYEVGQTNGWCWLLMELVDGANLREVMSTGRLSPEQALKLVPQLCDALQYAHDRGVVHRDIKPENILIDTQGRLKLTDFGLAKLISKGDEKIGANLTQTGAILGTMHYMAPEQLVGEKVDHRADIYAVGVVLYEMLTGGLPLGRFQPPSRQIAVDVRVDEVVLKALDKDPEQRYQRASDVRSDVERVSSDVKFPPSPEKKVKAVNQVVNRTRPWFVSWFFAMIPVVLLCVAAIGMLAGSIYLSVLSLGVSLLFGIGFGVRALIISRVPILELLLSIIVEKDPRQLFDRRIVYGIIMTLSGSIMVGLSIFIEFSPKLDALFSTRAALGPGIPFTYDEVRFALTSPTPISTWLILCAFAGLAMVVGGWSLLSLRMRGLAVFGGICSALFGIIVYDAMGHNSVFSVICVIIAALCSLLLIIFTLKSKLAACFDHVPLSAIGLSKPGASTVFGFALLLTIALSMGVAAGSYAAARRLLVTNTIQGPWNSNQMPGVAYNVSDVIKYRTPDHEIYFSAVGEKLSDIQQLLSDINNKWEKYRILAEDKRQDEKHNKTADAIMHLSNMRRGRHSLLSKDFFSSQFKEEYTWANVAEFLCAEARLNIAICVKNTKALLREHKAETNKDASSEIAELLGAVVRDYDDLDQQLEKFASSYASASRYMGVLSPEKFMVQRDYVIELTDKILADPQQMEVVRKQLTKDMYSREQIDLLLKIKQQVSPYSGSLIRWLGEVLNNSTPSKRLYFEDKGNVEQ